MSQGLEIGASVLSFAGGIVLSIDALMVKKRIRARAAASSLRNAIKQLQFVVRNPAGEALVTEEDWELWLANRSSQYAWIGFILMAIGFLLDLLNKTLFR